MAIYSCFRADLASGTNNPKDLVSVKYLPSATATAIENGQLVCVGGFITGSREVRTGTTPAANTALASLAIIGSEEVVKTETYNGLAEFINEAGAICRGYRLRTGDIFSVTAEALNVGEGVTVTVGSTIVEAMAGTKLNCVATLTSNSTKIGTIIAKETQGDKTWYTFEVV